MNSSEILPTHYSHKPFKFVPYKQPSSTWLSRHVQWLKQERHSRLEGIGVLALGVFEGAILSSTGVGLYLLYKAYQESTRSGFEKQFFEEYKTATPPAKDRIKIKTETRTFNHVFDFAIENKVTWWRYRHKGEWQLFYFDGYENGREPVEMDADGANLEISDDAGYMHYKKTFREYRIEQISANPKAKEKLGDLIDFEQDKYIVVGKMEKNNWKRQAFTLPIAHYLYYYNPFQQERHFRLPDDTLCWAVSHRGQYNRIAEDGRGYPYPVEVGVSNLFRLKKNGKDIPEHDPWSPPFADMGVSLPETAYTTFKAIKIKAAASTLMAIGYEIQANGQATLQIKTRLTDIDYELWNPIFKSDYFEHLDDKNVRIFPKSEWQDHPLIMQDGSSIQEITKYITITQIGEGNQARKLYVEGNKDGQRGYYVKHLSEEYWHFKPTSAFKQLVEDLLPRTISFMEPFETSVRNYNAKKCLIYALPHLTISAKLFQFGQRSSESILELTMGEESFKLRIHRKKVFKNFLGIKGDSFDLVIPSDLQEKEILRQAFQGLKVIPLTVKEEKEGVILSSIAFAFEFIIV